MGACAGVLLKAHGTVYHQGIKRNYSFELIETKTRLNLQPILAFRVQTLKLNQILAN